MIEELFDVDIDHPALPRDRIVPDLSHRIVRAASRPKPIASIAEPRFPDRPQHLQQQLLDEAVQDGRDPQLPAFAVRLRYLDFPDRRRRVGPPE